MTEAEWNACTVPQAMLEFLRGKASDRKLRLFVVACCYLSQEKPPRVVVPVLDVAERFADGQATLDEVRSYWIGNFAWPERPSEWAFDFVDSCPVDEELAGEEGYPSLATAGPVLRDVFGPLPFRPVTLETVWRTSTVTQLAETIYQHRAYDRLPILGDALEDAGCGNADILSHCRGPGSHVRGCWVVDLLTGRK